MTGVATGPAWRLVGTAAMFLVGGGILVHGVPALHHAVEHLAAGVAASLGGAGAIAAAILPTLAHAVIGIVAGGLTVAVVTAARRLLKRG